MKKMESIDKIKVNVDHLCRLDLILCLAKLHNPPYPKLSLNREMFKLEVQEQLPSE